MEEFYLKVYLFRPNRVPPIKIARNSKLKITIETMDYTIPVGATASAFAKGAFSVKIYTQKCTVDGNRVSFTPEPGFFVQGRNILQYEIGDSVIPLAIDVNCEISLPDGGGATKPEQVLPYVTRAENAARRAEDFAGNAASYKAAAERSAQQAAESQLAVQEKQQAAMQAAENAANSMAGANNARDSAGNYAAKAKEFANAAAGYAGAATVSIGWDADGYFSIFEQEE